MVGKDGVYRSTFTEREDYGASVGAMAGRAKSDEVAGTMFFSVSSAVCSCVGTSRSALPIVGR